MAEGISCTTEDRPCINLFVARQLPYILYLLMCKINCENLYGLLPGKYLVKVNLGAHPGKYEYWPAIQQIFTEGFL